MIVIPATQKIYLDAMEEGLLKTFIEAGAVVSTPTVDLALAVIWEFLQSMSAAFPPQTVTS